MIQRALKFLKSIQITNIVVVDSGLSVVATLTLSLTMTFTQVRIKVVLYLQG